MGCVLAYLACFIIWIVGTEISTVLLRGADLIGSWLDDVASLLIVLATPVIGSAIFGFAQWKAALQGRVSKSVWLFTSVASNISSFTAIYIVAPIFGSFTQAEYLGILRVQSGRMSGLDDRFLLGPLWLAGVIYLGVVWGIATGIPQWLVLRRHFNNTNGWLGITILGSLAMFGAFAAFVHFLRSTIIVPTLSCCIGPVIFSAVTGTMLYGILSRPKQMDANKSESNASATPLQNPR
jgi:hypothetical protein